MKIYGLLSWYEEPPAWLAACVASMSKLCDGVVAVDGAYALYPGALRHPTSGSGQAMTIVETAAAMGMSCAVHIPNGPWMGNEVEKLETMFHLAQGKVWEDWYLKIDADEVVSDVPPDLRRQLETTDKHIVELRMWQRVEYFGDNHMWPIRRLYRVLPNMRWGPAHHIVTADLGGERVVMTDSEDPRRQIEPLDMQDLRLEHRTGQRPEGRKTKKDRYYQLRDELGVEKEPDGVPSSG